ncbi:hypothetical protein SMNI109538_02275 [Smaragdicoccus niigatensis]
MPDYPLLPLVLVCFNVVGRISMGQRDRWFQSVFSSSPCSVSKDQRRVPPTREGDHTWWARQRASKNVREDVLGTFGTGSPDSLQFLGTSMIDPVGKPEKDFIR